MLRATIFLVLFGLAFCEIPDGTPEVEVEDDVLVLTTKNFDYVLSNNQHVLVEFYAPWCGHCKALAPEYAKAAAQLKKDGSEVKLGKVDATVESELGTKYGVRGYPTLKFMKNGKPTEYGGGRQAADIVSWLKKKTGPPATDLKTDEDVKKFKEDNEVVVIGYFADATGADAKKYIEVADSVDDVPFGIIADADVASKETLAAGQIAVFKQIGKGRSEKSDHTTIAEEKLKAWVYRTISPLVQEMSEEFDEGRMNFEGDLSEAEALSKFVKENQLRLVTEFTPETAPKIFGGEIQVHNLLFISKQSSEFDETLDNLKQAAAQFKGKVLFIYIDTDQADNERVMEFFGLQKSDVPDYRIIKMSENMAKFKPDTKDLSADAIAKFTESVLSGELKRHLMSADQPEDWDKNPVTVLVGKNFKEVAYDKSKKVFVEFYAPWCGHCKSLAPTWEKLGENFQSSDDVVIAKMDSTANEVEDFEISGFPTLKYFPSGAEDVMDYDGDRTLEAMIKFVESNGKEVSGGDGGDDGEEVDEGGIPTGRIPPKEYAPADAEQQQPPAEPAKSEKPEAKKEEKPKAASEELDEELDDAAQDEMDAEIGGKDEL